MGITSSDQPEQLDTIKEEAERRMALVDEAVRMYGQYILNYFFSLTRCWEQAKDCYQDLWCHILERFPEEDITHIGILRMKAYQLFADKWRRQRNSPVEFVEQLPENQVTSVSLEPSNEEEEQRFKAKFFSEHSYLNLTSDQKTAVWYHCRYGYTLEETAKLMNIASSTIADWITKAKQCFASHLDINR